MRNYKHNTCSISGKHLKFIQVFFNDDIPPYGPTTMWHYECIECGQEIPASSLGSGLP